MLIYLVGKVTSLAQLSRGQVPQRLESRAVFFSRNFKELFFRSIRTLKPDCMDFSGAASVFWDMFGKSEKSLQSYQPRIFYIIRFKAKGCGVWFCCFSPGKFVKETVNPCLLFGHSQRWPKVYCLSTFLKNSAVKACNGRGVGARCSLRFLLTPFFDSGLEWIVVRWIGQDLVLF